MDINITDIAVLLAFVIAGFFGWQWWKKKQEKKVTADPIAPTLAPSTGLFIPQPLPIRKDNGPLFGSEEIADGPVTGVTHIWSADTATPDAVRIAKQVFDSRTVPDGIYTSIEALLIDLRGLRFKHQVVVDGHLIWPIGEPGFGPPLTYAFVAGQLIQVNSALPGTAPPVAPTPTPPVPVQPPSPVMPTPPVPQPPAPPAFPGLTADEVRAVVQWNPPYHNKTDGERFPSHEARAAWVAAVLGQGQGGSTTVDVAPQYVDTRNWNHNNWLWFIAHPEVWPRVENTLYNNQMKNAHSQGGAMNVGGLPVRPDNL